MALGRRSTRLLCLFQGEIMRSFSGGAVSKRVAALASLFWLAWAPMVLAQNEPTAKAPETKLGAAQDHGLPQVRKINEEIRRVWEDNKLRPAVQATDGEWCRRVYLDVLGRVPSVTELREFLSSKESDRKAKLVNKLLYDSA